MVILARLVLASLLADFLFQPSSLVVWKQKRFSGLLAHIVIVFISSFLAGIGHWSESFLYLTLAISVAHLVIDWLKIQFSRTVTTGPWSLTAFILDQAMHIAAIAILVVWFDYLSLSTLRVLSMDPTVEVRYLALASVYIMSVLGGSVVVKHVVQPFQEDVKGRPGLLGAGAIIGVLERFLLMSLVAANQFGAVGFVLTAKSVARYKEIETVSGFAEYYLVGTLTSSTIALVAGLLTRMIFSAP